MISFMQKTGILLLALSLSFFVTSVVAEDDEGPLIIDRSSGGGNYSRNKGSFMELLSRLSQLENEIRQLRGDLEMATHDIKQMKTRQRELYNDIDRRIRDLELRIQGGGSYNRKSGSSSSGSSYKAPAKSKVAPADFTKVDSSERREYQAAFKLLRDSRYQQAIDAFRAFLTKYPQGSLAGNAQYWLAEAFYVSRDYNSAISEFQRVVTDYPKHSKVVGSKIKIGYCYYELKEYGKAKQVLRDVIRRYPRSSSAKLARLRLQRMNREGK